MMCQVTLMSRTCSASSTVREVIQAKGQRGSNQKSTLSTTITNRCGRGVFRGGAPGPDDGRSGAGSHRGGGDLSGTAETRTGRDPVTTGTLASIRVAPITTRVAGSPHAWNQPHPGGGRDPRLPPGRHVVLHRPGPHGWRHHI